MNTIEAAPQLAAARGGDHAAFEALVEPYRRELLVHCYRFFGSLEDGEDMLQETLLRAWRRLDTYEGRASFRAWLYKIATNVCLDALDRQRARSLPSLAGPAAAPGDPLPPPVLDPVWLEPLPDSLEPRPPLGVGAAVTDPETAYETRESVSLAFLAVLQQLPGRQRAVLILRDVLGFEASETAQILDVTVAAVTSALQRARATMRAGRQPKSSRPAEAEEARLLARYMQAWEMADPAGLVSLLREDAVLSMPPTRAWFHGRADIGAFLVQVPFAGRAAGRYRLLPTRANGAPACAVYQLGESGSYEPAALNILVVEGDQIAEMHDFLSVDAGVFERFGLPARLPAGA
jgi:RNA polymerase sigma-70 factor, ECF subfamily